MEIIKKISIAKTLRSMQVGDKVAFSPLQVNYTSLRVAITRLNSQGWELTARRGEKNIIVERKK